jgi:hypothetical protein
LTPDGFQRRVSALFKVFHQGDYLKEKTGLTKHEKAEGLNDAATLYLGFGPFPLERWGKTIPANALMDIIEFLWDRVSKPGEWGDQYKDDYRYQDYYEYDEQQGKDEFRAAANVILGDFQRHILPQWGHSFLDDIRAVKVEAWFSSLPYAPATKAKFRNQMSCVYAHAIRHTLGPPKSDCHGAPEFQATNCSGHPHLGGDDHVAVETDSTHTQNLCADCSRNWSPALRDSGLKVAGC